MRRPARRAASRIGWFGGTLDDLPAARGIRDAEALRAGRLRDRLGGRCGLEEKLSS